MAQLIQVRLSRHDAQPWGFRLSGGKDFGTPLVVQKVAGGSLADKAGLIPGDAVVKVNDFDVFSLRHKDAQDIIVRSGNCFDLTLQRGGSTWRPHVTATGSLPTPSSQLGHIAPVTRTSLAHKPQEVRHIGSGYNNSARPYGGINGTDGHVKSIVNKQYNSPVGIYSEEAIAETLSAQAEVLAGGVLGVNFKKNEKIYNAANSEVLKMLHEQENDPEPDEQDPYQSTLQHSPRPRFEQEQPHYNTNPSVTKHVTAPVARPNVPNTGGIPAGQNICTECERLIVGVFVRVKDKNLHVDCFKCATCGTSLKNQGYFNFNNKLYCDIHAKMAAMKNPPAGTEGYVPVPIKANQKLSASTISAALDSVGVHANGTAPPSHNENGAFVEQPLQLSHSRTSSSSSSSAGTANSYISSLSPNKSLSPEKLSPAHSRQSSESGIGSGSIGSNNNSCNSNNSSNSNSLSNSIIIQTANPSAATLMYSKNESSINHKQNENDMNTSNRRLDDISATDGGSVGQHQLQQHTNVNDNGYNAMTTPSILNRNGYNDAPAQESIYGTIRPNTKVQPHEEFQYITLDGSVIKSVIPPGKGIKTNYKVHSGYGGPKPFNAGGPLSPHSGGPRSPSSYPPPAPNQAPSWAQPKPAPKPAVNPYATLPRTGGNTNIPIPPPPPLPKPSEAEATARLVKPSEVKNEFEKKASPYRAGEATQMLAKSLERVNVSNKEKFNNHAGQIISNMLEKRLAAANNQIASNGINGSPNAVNVKNTYNATVKVTPPPAPVEPKSLSPHSLKKVTELSDKPPNPPPFPIETKVSPTHSVKKVLEISAKPPNPPPFPIELKSSPQHPMKKILDLCEKPAPLDTNDNSLTLPNANSSQRVLTTATVIISPPPPPPVQKTPETITTTDTASPSDLNSETVVYRNKPKNQLTTHAVDRRSYIEKDGRRESLHESNEAGNGVEEVQTTTMAEELKDGKQPVCCQCNARITRGPFITALGRIWCPDHFICVNANCRRALQDIGFVEEKGDLYCEYCFEKYLAPTCSKCSSKIKGDCLNAIGKHFHPECFTCVYCGKLFGNSPFFLEEGEPYCEADWNELFTTKCFACGFPVEAGDKWVEALNHNYHSQCFNCTYCKKNLEGQSFYNKGGRPFCKNHAR